MSGQSSRAGSGLRTQESCGSGIAWSLPEAAARQPVAPRKTPPEYGGVLSLDELFEEDQLGRTVEPISASSIARAAWRPSRIAQTTSDWPRRTSPAVQSLSTEVL